MIAATVSNAASTFTLNPYSTFGGSPFRGDGSIQPVASPLTSDSMGNSPYTGNPVLISAPGATSAWFPAEATQDQRPTGSTNGFNMRGLTWDAVSHNLIFCDTHEGSGGTVGGAGALSPYSAIYILDGASGAIIAGLNTNGIVGGAYTHVVPGVSDDGVVYICNQTTASQTTGFKIYRWATADTNNPSFGQPPVVAFSNVINSANSGTSGERIGQTMDVRGSGPNTQIILGTSSLNGTGTNVFVFTTTDGTNFTPHRIGFSNVITTPVFNDGIAFGPGNTFFAKQVGRPFLFCSFDLTTNANYAGKVILSSPASSVNDPLLNICAIAYDPVNKLLAGLEQIGGTATGGRGKVWLFDLADPTNHPPAVLASRIYTPNFQKTTAPMGYLRFSTNGVLYAHASNNGFLASTVDSIFLSPPTFTTDLPASTRVAQGQNAHFEVFAVADVTNYQWYSNSIPIPGATTYSYDIPNVTSGMSGVFNVVAFNAAGSTTSANSTLTIVSPSQFFHPVGLWSVPGNTLALNNPTNFITQNGAAGTPNERCIAYNALSNQLLVVRGPSMPNLKIMVVDADSGTNGYLYTLNTNGLTAAQSVTLAGIGVADDGAVYACTVASDTSFKVYRWANTDSNTIPITIFGTNSAASNTVAFPYNPISDLQGSTTFRFGDVLAVRGSGANTEILLDSQNNTTFASILTPTDSSMTNWTENGYVLKNTQGSYGSSAYGSVIGRSLQFGSGNTFWQKRYNAAAGAPLAQMRYTPGAAGLSQLVTANTSPGLFTNGPVGISPTLSVAAGINFVGAVGTDSTTTQDTLSYYDLTDPGQAVLIGTQPLPQGNSGFHKGNANAIGQVIFGFNAATGTNYLFVLDGNNGVAAFVLSGGITPPPRIVLQPHNLRVLESSSGSMTVTLDQIANIKWYKGTNSPVDTGVSGISYNIANATTSDAGDYFVIATNVNGAVTSSVAHVTVALTNDNYTLSPVWSATPGNVSFPYVSSDGGANTPNERAFAYNAASNQLIVVRCPPASTAYTVYVVDAASGSVLYNLNTTGVIHEGPSEASGSNPIDLVGAVASDDGSIYICSESPNASGGAGQDPAKMFHVYRWTNSAPTTPPVMVYEGDPSGQPAGVNERWGDVLTARGTGTNTELFVNSQSGTYGAVLRPKDASLNNFTNFWFTDSGGGGSIGRSIQFAATNSVYEKRKGSPLVWSSYDTNAQTSGVILQIDSSTTLGGVAVDASHNLAIGVDFVGSTVTPLKPDAVAVYDVTDPSTPMLLKRQNFPVNQVVNANVICETVISGNRVFSLDANNGLVAFYIIPPVNSMKLNITHAGSSVNLSWGNANAVLQSSPTLNPPNWTDLAGPGVTNSVQPASGTNVFYRLIQRL